MASAAYLVSKLGGGPCPVVLPMPPVRRARFPAELLAEREADRLSDRAKIEKVPVYFVDRGDAGASALPIKYIPVQPSNKRKNEYGILVGAVTVHLLNAGEMRGLLAHEIVHIADGDLRDPFALEKRGRKMAKYATLLIGGVVLPIAIVSTFAVAKMLPPIALGDTFAIAMAMSVAVIVAARACSALLRKMAQLTLGIVTGFSSRKREYATDKAAAELTCKPEEMASALIKLEVHSPASKRKTLAERLADTHPPTAKRVKRLISQAREMGKQAMLSE